jgi:hypothetical protein
LQKDRVYPTYGRKLLSSWKEGLQVAMVYFYLTLGFESSATWQSREQVIKAVSVVTRQTDFDAKSFLVGYFKPLSVFELYIALRFRVDKTACSDNFKNCWIK